MLHLELSVVAKQNLSHDHIGFDEVFLPAEIAEDQNLLPIVFPEICCNGVALRQARLEVP